MAKPVTFWFEFASTYSYLAAMRIDAEAKTRGVEVEWKPFLLGPIFAQQGWNTSPFNVYPAKGLYMWRDMEREAAKYHLPFRRPDPTKKDMFPQHSVLAARCALVGLKSNWGKEFCRSVFVAEFFQGANISDPDVISGLLEAVDVDPDEVTAQAQAPEEKHALRINVETAQQMGMFGAPSFVVDGELFWGNDRLEDALDWAIS